MAARTRTAIGTYEILGEDKEFQYFRKRKPRDPSPVPDYDFYVDLDAAPANTGGKSASKGDTPKKPAKNNDSGLLKLFRAVTTTVPLVFIGYQFLGDPIERAWYEATKTTNMAYEARDGRARALAARTLAREAERIDHEYWKFLQSQQMGLERFTSPVPGATHVLRALYPAPDHDVYYSAYTDHEYNVRTIIKYRWNGNDYEEEERFAEPTGINDLAKKMIASMSSPQAVRKMEDVFGTTSVLNAMVVATTNDNEEAYGLHLLSRDRYERYLRVVDEETGRDFTGAYNTRNPKFLTQSLYHNTISPEIINSDPRLAVAILIGKGIHDASGGNWETHLKRLEKAGVTEVSQFRSYNNGRGPDPRELEKALRNRVITYNPLTDRAPEATYPSTTTRWNGANGSSGSTTTYHFGESRGQGMQRSVQERSQQLRQQQQENLQNAQRDVGRAVQDAQKAINDIFKKKD